MRLQPVWATLASPSHLAREASLQAAAPAAAAIVQSPGLPSVALQFSLLSVPSEAWGLLFRNHASGAKLVLCERLDDVSDGMRGVATGIRRGGATGMRGAGYEELVGRL